MAREGREIICNTLPLQPGVLVEHNALADDLDALNTIIHGTNLITATVLSRGSTDTAIATTAFTFRVSGVTERKAAVTTGTAIGAQTVPQATWALYRLSIAAGGTITVTPAAANATGYATEALAIAALPATPASSVDMGYLTVQAQEANDWIAATDALAGGTTGNEAQATNFYPATPEWMTAGLTGKKLFG